jgi:carbonic anhydrase
VALSPEQALKRLIQGNARFRDPGHQSVYPSWNGADVNRSQRPFAIILGCSDSRTPVEILFDQGLGDLFVVRIAGNIVAPSIVGSIEYAAGQFGIRLVVVMGHTLCGAVAATLDALTKGIGPATRNIRDLTDRIAPHIGPYLAIPDPERRAHEAMRANVRASVDHLRHGSQLLEEQVRSGRIMVVGAEYELETGKVSFLDLIPAARRARRAQRGLRSKPPKR